MPVLSVTLTTEPPGDIKSDGERGSSWLAELGTPQPRARLQSSAPVSWQCPLPRAKGKGEVGQSPKELGLQARPTAEFPWPWGELVTSPPPPLAGWTRERAFLGAEPHCVSGTALPPS